MEIKALRQPLGKLQFSILWKGHSQAGRPVKTAMPHTFEKKIIHVFISIS